MNNCVLLLCFIGVVENCNASLSVSEYASEGTRGLLHCDFYTQKSTKHVVWYREKNINITTCNYPGHCEFPLNPRYEAFINSQSSTFAISEANYYKDDGRWYCRVNGLESSINFTVTSIPSSFRFTSPRESGIFVPDDGLTLNATAMCLYPKPNIVNLQYRIEGDKHYINFTRREANVQYFKEGTSRCLKHQSVMFVTIDLYNEDFHFERDTSVLFQFSYMLQSKKEKITEEVIAIKFSSRKITSTLGLNCETEKPSVVKCTTTYPDPTTTITTLTTNSSEQLPAWAIVLIVLIFAVTCTCIVIAVFRKKIMEYCPPSKMEHETLDDREYVLEDIHECDNNDISSNTEEHSTKIHQTKESQVQNPDKDQQEKQNIESHNRTPPEGSEKNNKRQQELENLELTKQNQNKEVHNENDENQDGCEKTTEINSNKLPPGENIGHAADKDFFENDNIKEDKTTKEESEIPNTSGPKNTTNLKIQESENEKSGI